MLELTYLAPPFTQWGTPTLMQTELVSGPLHACFPLLHDRFAMAAMSQQDPREQRDASFTSTLIKSLDSH